MTIIEALENAKALLEAEGHAAGDVVLDLDIAIRQIKKHPKVAAEELV